MYREDYHRVADLVEAELFDSSDSGPREIWNMAITVAARTIRRYADEHAEWAPTEPTQAPA